MRDEQLQHPVRVLVDAARRVRVRVRCGGCAMSGREWKPGDVALIRSSYGTEVVAVRCGPGEQNMGWSYGDTLNGEQTHAWSRDTGQAIRPLVVIDPEDREQVERLRDALPQSYTWTAIQDALRSLITDPKPEEPTGLGAVVEADDGATWVRADLHAVNCWVRAGFGIRSSWPGVAAVRVLSEGIK